MTTTVTKTAKVIAALESGVELTAKQIESRYNVANAIMVRLIASIASVRLLALSLRLGIKPSHPKVIGGSFGSPLLLISKLLCRSSSVDRAVAL